MRKYKLTDPGLDRQALLLHETLFHNANGYIGVRSCFEEGYPEDYTSVRGAYINGVYDYTQMKQAEKLYGLMEEKQTILNVADPQSIELTLGDESFNMFSGQLQNYSRELDMDAGQTVRMVSWTSPKGKEIELEIRRMTSFVRLPVFLLEYRLTSKNYSGPVRLVSGHRGDVRNFSDDSDPRVAAEAEQYLHEISSEVHEESSVLLSGTSKSDIEICTSVSHVFQGGACDIYLSQKGFDAEHNFDFDIAEGQTVLLHKYCVFTDSRRFENPKAAAQELLQQAMHAGAEILYKEQRDYLHEFWKHAELKIQGGGPLELAVNYNLYQLMAAAGKDICSNVAAKGLSGEGYEGHYFWDTETYIQPFFNLSSPEIAKNLIMFRYNILPAARENAKRLGHSSGALYPWRTIMGEECSGFFPAGEAQYHINADVARSVVAYYLATGDWDFVKTYGAEILFETARLWLDVGVYADGMFQIHDVTGPDEYSCIVNNNYYTNVAAKYNLSWAAKVYERLAEEQELEAIQKTGMSGEEAEAFKKAAEEMCLPHDEKRNLTPQDDSFLSKKPWDFGSVPESHHPLLLHYHPLHLYRHQVCKQADAVLAHFIYSNEQSEETMRNSFHFYEGITTHDSSLSTCIFSIMAARLGEMEKAEAYFGDSAFLDLNNMHGNTKDGLHIANMGGTYMAIVYGFGGLQIDEQGIALNPRLPESWQSLSYPFQYRGRSILVELTKTRLKVTLQTGEQLFIHIAGSEYLLKSELVLEL